MIRHVLQRAVVGLIVVAVGAASYFGIRARYGAYGDYYHVTAEVPRATQLLRVGTDVRQSGVTVGTVSDIALEGRHVELTLQIEQRYRVPQAAEAFVDLKTLLGDKFVDLRAQSFGEPFLRDGDRIEGHVGPELEEVLEEGVEVLRAINPENAATVIHELAVAARGRGDDIARGLRAGSRLSTTFAETMPDQLRGLRDFRIIFGELERRAEHLNFLADAVNEGVPVYASDRAQALLRRSLEAVAPMARDFADLLLFHMEDWATMMDFGDVVLQTIVQHASGFQNLVHGLGHYVFKLSGDPFPWFDGSAAAPFANFFGSEGEEGHELEEAIEEFCHEVEDSPIPVPPIPICEEVGG